MTGLTADQKANRRTFIGGSDAAAIVAGGDEWLKLWREKTGRSDGDDLSGVLAAQLGIFTEPFNIAWYEKMTGRKVCDRGVQLRDFKTPYLGCTLDGTTTTASGEPASFQAKHVGKAGDQLTIRYTAQCTHEALVTVSDWWVMSTLIGNSRWELTEQQVDPFFAQSYLQRCESFWRYVAGDIEPPDNIRPLGVPAPKEAWLTVHLDDDTRAGWPNWGSEFVDSMGKWANTLAAHQAHETAKGEMKKLMPEDVGVVLRGRIKVARDRAGAVRPSLLKGEGK